VAVEDDAFDALGVCVALSPVAVVDTDGGALKEPPTEAELLEVTDIDFVIAPVGNNTVGDARIDGVAEPDALIDSDMLGVPEFDGETAATVPDTVADTEVDIDGRSVAEMEGDWRGDDDSVLVIETDEDVAAVREIDGDAVGVFETKGDGVDVLERTSERETRGELDTVADESGDSVSEACRGDGEELVLTVVLRESTKDTVLETLKLEDGEELTDVLFDVTGDREFDAVPRGERDNVGEPDDDFVATEERVGLVLTLFDELTDVECDVEREDDGDFDVWSDAEVDTDDERDEVSVVPKLLDALEEPDRLGNELSLIVALTVADAHKVAEVVADTDALAAPADLEGGREAEDESVKETEEVNECVTVVDCVASLVNEGLELRETVGDPETLPLGDRLLDIDTVELVDAVRVAVAQPVDDPVTLVDSEELRETEKREE
jgi:hypothetical protein